MSSPRVLQISIVTLLFLVSCAPRNRNTINISGKAQGTTYNITYLAGAYSNYRESIDSIFRQIDLSLSTYVPGSIISRLNRNDSSVTVDEHFEKVLTKSLEVSVKTGGLFDATVAPLVNAYGFGPSRKRHVDKTQIDSVLKFVGYKKVSLKNGKLIKTSPGVMLDFNAIAQGYTVDVLASFLESKGIHNYLIELGGEIRARGKKLDGGLWTIGIEQPDENAEKSVSLNTMIGLKDRSLATSGNYNQFYEEEGKKYTHIINPITGLPAKSNLLSATVIAGDCMTADAYATSFMVMGIEGAKSFLKQHPDLKLECFFIYDDGGTIKTYTSENFSGHIDKHT